MFDTILGLPLHPLVVHVVVVLLPLACVGAVAIAIVPGWNRRFGILAVGCAFVATGAAVLAKESGERLASRVGLPITHAAEAKWVPVFSGLLFLAVAALWWYDRSQPERRANVTKAIAVVTVVVAVIALGWVAVAGHSGATDVWTKVIQSTTPGAYPSE